METQGGSHDGDPSQFTQWRPKAVHTMETQASSHNGDPRRFTQWRSKAVHTLEIQAGSHNGDPKSHDPDKDCPLALVVLASSGYFAYTLAIMQAKSQRLASSRTVHHLLVDRCSLVLHILHVPVAWPDFTTPM